MKTAKLTLSITLGLFLMIPASAQSQDLTFSQNTGTMTIEGTSNLHDWEEDVTEFSGTVVLADEIDNLEGQNNSIEQVNFTAKVSSIESDKSLMNKKTYEALKEKDHPNIIFTSTKSKLYKTLDASKGQYVFVVYGNLEMAGKTKQIYFPVKTKLNGDGSWNVSGQKKIYLEWFEIDPPTAMMGTVTVGEEVQVLFDLNLVTSENASN